MKLLAIETSCDETAVAVLLCSGDMNTARFNILGNALYSQAAKHAEFGGVYPSLAKREHQKNLVPLTIRALTEAGSFAARKNTTINRSVFDGVRDEQFKNDILEFLETTQKPDIDLIAVTRGPGLEPALWTGISFAEALGAAWDIPVIGVDHMEGHILSALLRREENHDSRFTIHETKLPLLALLISGGHTELVLMKDWFEYELIGKTRDDAAGEAFDKVARLLGLPYPGGPEIARAALRARERPLKTQSSLPVAATQAEKLKAFSLPRPMLREENCDFSFSGLKTAVVYLVRGIGEISDETREDIAREFEDAVTDVVVAKTKRALQKTGAQTLIVGGGVSANRRIREGLLNLAREEFSGIPVFFPDAGVTGDNAIMIGAAGYVRKAAGKIVETEIKAVGKLRLDTSS